MRILQINTVYGTGSTGKIVAAINDTIEKNGHEFYVAYGRGKRINDERYFRIGNKLDFVSHVLINFFQGRSGFGSKYVTKRFLKWVDGIQPDIIHMHNIHGFYIHVGLLFEYIKEKNIKVVWTLHDCWPFTGQCAYFDYSNCDKWKEQCCECPIYRTEYPYSLFKDNSMGNYIEKRNAFSNLKNAVIVTPSMWLATKVKESYLKEYLVHVINNGIDIDLFSPIGSKEDKKIILAIANVWDKRKGLEYVLNLADDTDVPEEYLFVVIGVSPKQKRQIEKKYSKNRVLARCRATNQQELVEWYSRAFVYINPTLEDNYPTTNLEAQACGTPVITFRTGGSPESLRKDTGIVVDKANYNQLKEAMLNLEVDDRIRKLCRENALDFDKSKCFDKYIELYDRVMECKITQ